MTRVSVRLVPHLIASTAVIGTLAACSGSQGPAGPVLTGNRAGVVYLFDQFGGALASDSGMTVVANPGSVTSVSNTAGQYTLTNLKTGVYTISFTASGFGTFVQPRVQFVGGGTIEVAPIDFSQQSTGVITGLTATPNVAGDTLTLTGTITAPPPGVTRSIRLFFSTSSTPSAAIGSYTVTTVKTGFGASAFTYRLTGADMESLDNNFPAATTVYVVAYGDSFYENSYEDSTSGKTVYPNVSATASNVASFTMP
jgi:hypothetical protein